MIGFMLLSSTKNTLIFQNEIGDDYFFVKLYHNIK